MPLFKYTYKDPVTGERAYNESEVEHVVRIQDVIKLHSFNDEPAVVDEDGNKWWYTDGWIHRLSGPAIVNADGTEEYLIRQTTYSKEKWEKHPYVLEYRNLPTPIPTEGIAGKLLRSKDTTLSKKQELICAGLGLAGEGREVADIIKKYIFHKEGICREELLKEAGDVLWYLCLLVNNLGSSIEEVADMNYKKLLERYPDGCKFNRGDDLEIDKIHEGLNG